MDTDHIIRNEDLDEDEIKEGKFNGFILLGKTGSGKTTMHYMEKLSEKLKRFHNQLLKNALYIIIN